MNYSIVIFGGTFDPPHVAHAALPPLVARQIHGHRIIYVPAAINPLKADHPPAPAEHRLAMLRLAIRDVPGAEISTIELERSGPSYTIDTIESLRATLGRQVEMRLLIGADQALEFQRWKRWKELVEFSPPTVMLRPPLDRAAFVAELWRRYESDIAARWVGWIVDVPQMNISATEVRRRVAAGEETTGMLDAEVWQYILKHGLYGAARPAANSPR